MISLSELLFEIYSRKDAYSWLSPDGKFISFPGNKTHEDIAIELINKYYSDEIVNRDYVDFLQKRNWQRITHEIFGANVVYCNNRFGSPNDVQKRKLIQLCIDCNFKELIWDNDKKDVILWSSKDL